MKVTPRLREKHFLPQRLAAAFEKCFDAGLSAVYATDSVGKTTSVLKYISEYPPATSRFFYISFGDLPEPVLLSKLAACINPLHARSARDIEALNSFSAPDFAEAIKILSAIPSKVPAYFVFDNCTNLQNVISCLGEKKTTELKGHSSHHHIILITADNPGNDLPLVSQSDFLMTPSDILRYFSINTVTLAGSEAGKICEKCSGNMHIISLLLYNILQTLSRNYRISQTDLLDSIFENTPYNLKEVLLLLSSLPYVDLEMLDSVLKDDRRLHIVKNFLDNFPQTTCDKNKKRWRISPSLQQYSARQNVRSPLKRILLRFFDKNASPYERATFYYRTGNYKALLKVDFDTIAMDSVCGISFCRLMKEVIALPLEIKETSPINVLKAALYLFHFGHLEDYENTLREMEPVVKKKKKDSYSAYLLMASAFRKFPRMPEMQKCLEEAVTLGNPAKCRFRERPFFFDTGVPSVLALIPGKAGNTGMITAQVQKMENMLNSAGAGCSKCSSNLLQGEILFLQGQTEEAELCAYRTRADANLSNNFSALAGAALLLARIARTKGDEKKAADIMKELRRQAKTFPARSVSYAAFTAEFASVLEYQGSQVEQLSNVTSPFYIPDYTSSSPAFFLLSAAYCCGLVTQGKHKEALGFVDALTDSFFEMSLPIRQFLLLISVRSLLSLHNYPRAAEILSLAVDLSEKDGLWEPFALMGEDLPGLFPFLSERQKKLLQSPAEEKERRKKNLIEMKIDSVRLPDPLTARETEIVSLAAMGLHNREIAKKLCLSERTVSNRLYTAYQKLSISSRAQLRDLLK